MIALRALQLYRNSPIERYREEIVQKREYTEKIFHHQQMSNDDMSQAHLFFNDKTITEHKSNAKALVLFVSSLSSSSSVVLGDDAMREKLDDV